MTQPVEFPCLKECAVARCGLREHARNPGVPTRQWPQPAPPDKPVSVVLVGEAPGNHEDQQNTCWVGVSGQMLGGFIEASHLLEHADIYLSNVCRCRPPQDKTPTKTQLRRCLPHLWSDIELILTRYQGVVLFLQGASACQAVLGCKLQEGFTYQGQAMPIPLPSGPRTIPVFLTFHPAKLLPGSAKTKRNPELINAVYLHWEKVRTYLRSPDAYRRQHDQRICYGLGCFEDVAR